MISLTPLILVPSRPGNVRDNAADGLSRAPLLNGGASTVQKVCRRSGACRSRVRPVDSSRPYVDSLGGAVISSYVYEIVTSGEIGQSTQPKEQPPRKLSGKRTA